jgi:hypothetical protein
VNGLADLKASGIIELRLSVDPMRYAEVAQGVEEDRPEHAATGVVVAPDDQHPRRQVYRSRIEVRLRCLRILVNGPVEDFRSTDPRRPEVDEWYG